MAVHKTAGDAKLSRQSRASIPERIVVPVEAGMHGTPALLAMFGLMSVVLLAALDQTIVGTALPRVVADLGGFNLYAWVATSYLLTSTIMVPIIGTFGDLYGRKPFVLASVVIFVAASALAGAAQSMIWLIIARGIQGVGAGMLQATAFASVSDMFPQPERRARWQGLITGTFAVSSLIGPSLGGVMTDTLGWRSVFYVNLPVGLLAIVLIWFMLPADLSPRMQRAGIDWAGVATITAGMSALLLAVEWGGTTMPWSSPGIISLFLISAVALSAFIVVEWRSAAPLLPVDLFKNPTILLISLISLVFGFMMFALSYYTPLLLQGGMGLSPSAAGAYLTPLAISTALGSLICTQIFARMRRMKIMMIIGGVLVLIGATLLLGVDANTSPMLLSIELALTGFGIGMQLPMTTILMQSIVPRTRLGVGTSTIQFLRLIGSTVGTAIIGSAVSSIFASRLVAATSPGTDPRLTAAFHNPQALVDPAAQAQVEQIASQLGPQATQQVALLAETARTALISGVWVGYVLGLVGAVVTFVMVLSLRVPDYRETSKVVPKEENTPEHV